MTTKTWTTTVDFDTGFKANLDDVTVADQLQLFPPTDTRPLPYLWVPGSQSNTVYRINTSGAISQASIEGRYRVGPDGGSPVLGNPSRTSVDMYGNCWVANRDGGSVVKIGLVVGGTRCLVDGTLSATGEYLKPPFTYNTCIDRDGDGKLRTSRGAASPVSGNGFDLKAWPAETPTGVANLAQDEAIYISQLPTGDRNHRMRHVSVDANGDAWVGFYTDGSPAGEPFYKINKDTGVATLQFTTDHGPAGAFFLADIGGHGGVIDGAGVLWSTSVFSTDVLRYDTTLGTKLDIRFVPETDTHNMCLDHLGNAWFAGFSVTRIWKVSPDGLTTTSFTHAAITSFVYGIAWNFADNTLWVSMSNGHVLNFSSTGTLIHDYATAHDFRGLAFSAPTKLWGVSQTTTSANRVETTTGAIDGTVNFFDGVNVLDSAPYGWGNMNGMTTLQSTSASGFWDVVWDWGSTNTGWVISWTATVPGTTTLTVEYRMSTVSQTALAALPFQRAGNGVQFAASGRYVEVRVTCRRPAGSALTPILFDISLADSGAAMTETFHNRRGRTNWEVDVSVQIPLTERLFEPDTRGQQAPLAGAEPTGFSTIPFDEGLDECISIIQKGGDRTTPMSWALAIINVGAGQGLSSLPASRQSNYALAWIWLDVPQWGEFSPALMMYNLTSNELATDTANGGQYSTQAFRAVLIHQYLEPGRRYNIAVQTKLDTGSPGGVSTATSWNHDGYLKVWVSQDGAAPNVYSFVDSVGGGTASGMEVIKGPTDSMRYFVKYGVRYAGRDAMFAGLGMRSIPWATPGFIPYGFDETPLKNGGFQVVDVTKNAFAEFYGSAATLLTSYVSGNAFITFNLKGLTFGNSTNGGAVPWGFNTGGGPLPWFGLGAGQVGAVFNADALRGYYAVSTSAAGAGLPSGARMRMGTYTEVAGVARMTVPFSAPFPANWTSIEILIQAFRWHQRELVIGEVRIWSTQRAYDDTNAILASRRKLSLRGSIDLSDATEPDLGNLIAYWRCDDSEGTTVKEEVVGGLRNGYFAPFGMGTSDGATRGGKLTFLSGEGEAPTLDLSENPYFMREVRAMLAGASQGFALEMTFVPTEAYYAVQVSASIPDSGQFNAGTPMVGSLPKFVPQLLSWDVKDTTQAVSGMKSKPRSILGLTHRGILPTTENAPFKKPVGFSVEVAERSDQDDFDPIVHNDLAAWYINGASASINRYDVTAPWVGRYVTIQIGIQSTGTADQYDVYISLHPKDAFLPASGDPADAEFAYWTGGAGSYLAPYNAYFPGAHLTIRKKDLARSIITLGKWDCGTLGFCDLQPRMLIEELRVYATSPAGALPVASGGILTLRNGKLEGLNALPQRQLTLADILQQVGPGLTSVNLTKDSATVTPGSSARFFTATPSASLQSLVGSFLYVKGDEKQILSTESIGTTQQPLYFVTSVAAGGLSAALSTPFQDATRSNAAGFAMRLVGYTNFQDDTRDIQTTLGGGTPYEPGVSTVSDVVLSSPLWLNQAPVTGDFRLRFYSPLGRTSLRDILPSWTRGLVTPHVNRNEILGIFSKSERIYAATRGCLFRADDRWRDDGPTPTLQKSLAFMGKLGIAGLSLPLEGDRLEFTTLTNVLFPTSPAVNSCLIYDFWVYLDDVAEAQTIFWLGDPNTDPSRLTSGTNSSAINLIFRLSRGKPELAFGSTAFYTGTTQPEKGLFTATCTSAIPVGRWTHIRWYLVTRTNAAAQKVLVFPYLKINGKTATVGVNGIDNGITVPLTYDWLRPSTIIQLGAAGVLAIGAAKDSYRAPESATRLAIGSLGGANVQPQRIQGWMHSLMGRVSQITITRQTIPTGATTGTQPPDFDPVNVSYVGVASTAFKILSSPEGIGHKVKDLSLNQYGTIVSHPFISLWHELGLLTNKVSFAEFGTQVYATNGSRVARIQTATDPETSGLAGVYPPSTAPDFSVERLPFWRQNFRNKITADPLNDPIKSALPSASKQINHFDNHGNNSLAYSSLPEIVWQNSPTLGCGVFAFKAYIKPRDIAGRVVLWSRRYGPRSGSIFVEIRDGRLTIGWYDLFLKDEVYIQTSEVVFTPGEWHYVDVRKQWPPQKVKGVGFTYAEGNWLNSYWAGGRMRTLFVIPDIAAGAALNASPGAAVTGPAAFAGFVVQAEPTAVGNKGYVDIIKTAGTDPAASTAVTIGGTLTSTVIGSLHRMSDQMIVRRFRTVATDPSTSTPLDARVGWITEFTTVSGAGFVVGSTLSNLIVGLAVSRTAIVLWASPVAGGKQTVCYYWTIGGSTTAGQWDFTNNVVSGGVTATGQTADPFIWKQTTSFTFDAYQYGTATPSGAVLVPYASQNFVGSAGGIITAPAGHHPFNADMVGLYWMWDTYPAGSQALIGQLYKITSVNCGASGIGTQITVVRNGTVATTDSFAGFTGHKGGVFTGVGLIKSTNFDASRLPDDNSSYNGAAFGSLESVNPLNGVTPFNGEFDSFGWTVVNSFLWASAGGGLIQDARAFEDASTVTPALDPSTFTPNNTGDQATIGSDAFPGPIYAWDTGFADNAPGALRFSDWVPAAGSNGAKGTIYSTNGKAYVGGGWTSDVSTQPNAGTNYAQPLNPPGAAARQVNRGGSFQPAAQIQAIAGVVPNTVPQPQILPDPHALVGVAVNTAPQPLVRTTTAGIPVVQFLQPYGTFSNDRFATVVFYDADQNVVSDPGPILHIRPVSEDAQNPSAQLRYLFTDLPFPRQSGNIELWIYMSLAGGTAGALFRAARVLAGTREVAVDPVESLLAQAVPLSFGQAAPPRCEIVAASRARMFYGALEAQPDAFLYSYAGFPVSMDFAKLERLTSGYGEKITLITEFEGYVVMMKRRACALFTIDALGNTVQEVISSGVGCVGHQSAVTIDGVVHFLSDRGPQVLRRDRATVRVRPMWLGENLKSFFAGTRPSGLNFDRRVANRASSTINRFRHQWVLAVKDVNTKRADVRVSMMYDGQDEKATAALYQGMNVTALGTVQRQGGGLDLMVGGTLEGFIVWLDRPETQLQLMGSDASAYGSSSFALGTDTQTYGVQAASAASLDSALDGMRGCVLRYMDAGGVEQTVLIYDTDGAVIHFADAIAAAITASATVTIGGQVILYETPFLDFGNPERRKIMHYVNPVMGVNAAGSLQVDLYRDFDMATSISGAKIIALAEAEHSIVVPGVEGRWIKTKLQNPALTVGQSFDLTAIIWRLSDEDQP